LQDGQPVDFSSTSLTETQKQYCQIEKELLTVQFGLLGFWQYVYGQRANHKNRYKWSSKKFGLKSIANVWLQ
jgi:ABC-type molybdenum transport system ATPase subunit/photorepair protein PhrA